MRNPDMADYFRDSALPAWHQCRRTANSAMTENDLLDLKANWKFCDHSYFRDLTGNQR